MWLKWYRAKLALWIGGEDLAVFVKWLAEQDEHATRSITYLPVGSKPLVPKDAHGLPHLDSPMPMSPSAREMFESLLSLLSDLHRPHPPAEGGCPPCDKIAAIRAEAWGK